MTDHPLDGKYLITSTSSYHGDIEKRSDGETEIKNSRTERFDDANCKWISTFEILNESQVKMTSIADPSNAVVDFLLTRPDGSPTRDPVTYETVLKFGQKGDRIQMSGQIEYGGEVVFLTLRKMTS